MGWLITLGVLCAFAALPLGVSFRYNASGALLRVILGPVKLTVFPRPKKEKKASSPKKEEPKKETPPPETPQPSKQVKPPKEETGGSLLDFVPLVKVALDFLGDFRRKLRMDEVYLRLILASSDPCDLAVNYGRTWAAVGNLIPALENLFVIKKRDVEVECDFAASQTLVIAHGDVTITLGRLIALAVRYGIRAVREFLIIQNKRKGGAEK